MLGAIARVEEYTAFGEQSFHTNGLIRQLSVLGEAASKLPASVRRQHPTIPWKAIIGMRNVMVQDKNAPSCAYPEDGRAGPAPAAEGGGQYSRYLAQQRGRPSPLAVTQEGETRDNFVILGYRRGIER
jgi:hypothetical protein